MCACQERNQQNAQFSTGPTSPEGKAISAQNSRKHGLFSAHPFRDPENQQRFDAYLQHWQRILTPITLWQHEQVKAYALLEWRMKQISAYEVEAVERYLEEDPEKMAKTLDRLATYELRLTKKANALMDRYRKEQTLQAHQAQEQPLPKQDEPEQFSEPLQNPPKPQIVIPKAMSAQKAQPLTPVLSPEYLAQLDAQLSHLSDEFLAQHFPFTGQQANSASSTW